MHFFLTAWLRYSLSKCEWQDRTFFHIYEKIM